jgi:glycosyltransferase involved in cell wall biosynthesis
MRIIWFSDFDLRGSGYANISTPICAELIERGHEVKAIGFGYNGEEHHLPFQLLPAMGLRSATASILNLQARWEADVLIVALDIPRQEEIMNSPYLREREVKYVGMFPVEADPLCFSWAGILMQMDKTLVISQFGTEEAKKMGVDATYVPVGIDTKAWPEVTPEQRSALRSSYGFDDDTFVVLTIADNQERKNLVAGMDMFAKFSEDKSNVKYVLVTREHNPVGWRLRDYAKEIGISENLMIFERGMAAKELWSTYAVSDVFLLPSKAEGLGMPLLEAMAVGIPCVATNCCGMKELLSDNRGFLLDYTHVHRDPFGNGRRYWVDVDSGIRVLQEIYEQSNVNNFDFKRIKFSVNSAREYVKSRTWDKAADVVEDVLLSVIDR